MTPAVILQKNVMVPFHLSLCESLSLPLPLMSSQPPSLSSPLTPALCHQSGLCGHAVVALLLRERI